MKDSVSILNAFRNKYYTDGNNTENGIVANAIDDILPEYVKLKEMSHGKWNKIIFSVEARRNKPIRTRICMECSLCKVGWAGSVKPKYCPNCGAKMDGDEG